MRRVYIDTCILRIALEANEGDPLLSRARAELDRADAVYLYSRILQLELLPVPTRNKRSKDLEFFNAYFESAEFVECTRDAADAALAAACATAMGAADALHVGCAIVGNADELVTAENPEKPLPQCKAISVRTIR